MESADYLTIALVLVGAVILFFAMLQTRKIFKLLTDQKFQRNWRNLFVLMAFFFLGYFGVIYIIYTGKADILQILTGVIFFFGAVFVFLVGLMGSSTFKMLQEANIGLEEKVNLLRARNDQLTQFNYATSHDLKEPINTVIGCISHLREEYGDRLDEKGQKFMRYAIQAADRMIELIEGLSDYLKIGRERTFTTANLNYLVMNVLEELQGSIQASNARVKVEDLPSIEVNEKEIKRVFQNLISNALKYRDPEKDPKIRVSAEPSNGHWSFQVKDNGIGIEENALSRVFQIFRQLHQRGQYEGMGIGLAICKKIVELHGGSIWVQSEPGKGSSFYFTLKAVAD